MFVLSKKARRVTFYILAIITLTLSLAFYGFGEIVDDYAETTLRNQIHARINAGIREYILTNADDFDSVVRHEYAPDGKLVSVSLDGAKMGLIQNGLEDTILKAVHEAENTGFSVPVGSLTGSRLLAGKGPNVNIKTVPLGTIAGDTVNEFESVGINHTLHRVALVFTVRLKAAAPFTSSELTVRFTVTLCESIILGEVPDYILN